MVILFGFILFTTLLALSIIDIKSFTLPNILTLPLIPLGILQSWVLTQDWRHSLIGAVIGYSVFVTLELSFKKIRGKDGLGRGDAKLLAVGGAWCGWNTLPIIILVASSSGLVLAVFNILKTKTHAAQLPEDISTENWIPFGPFLAFAIFAVWLYFHL